MKDDRAHLEDQCEMTTDKTRELMDLLARLIVSQEYFGKTPLTREEIPEAIKRIEGRITDVLLLMKNFIEARTPVPNPEDEPHVFADATFKVAGVICEFAARSFGRGLPQ